MTFVGPNLPDSALSADEGLAVLFALFDAGIPVEFGLVRYQASVLHRGLSNGALAIDVSLDVGMFGRRRAQAV